MALQEALSKIEEYNAIMQVPRSGLLGIGALQAGQPATRVAEEQLRVCVEACRLAQNALAGIVNSRNAILDAALQEIFKSGSERERLQKTMTDVLQTLEPVLDMLAGRTPAEFPAPERLEELAGELRSLSDQIKQAIPRDTYLTSLTGKTHPGFSDG